MAMKVTEVDRKDLPIGNCIGCNKQFPIDQLYHIEVRLHDQLFTIGEDDWCAACYDSLKFVPAQSSST